MESRASLHVTLFYCCNNNSLFLDVLSQKKTNFTQNIQKHKIKLR